MAPLGTLFATMTLTWKRIAPCSASRNRTSATKSRKSIERRMWVDISQLCQLCCSQLWPMHVQKDFVQWLVQDFVQWSFRICCSKSFSKKVRAIQRNFICCNFDSNMSSNARQILDPCSLRRSQKASLKNPWEHSSLTGTQKSRISWFKYACRPDTTHAPFDSNKF